MTETSASPDEWLSSQEAADRLGITLRTAYRLIDEGHLTAYKFGRVIRVRASDVESYIEASRIKPGDLAHLTQPRVGGSQD